MIEGWQVLLVAVVTVLTVLLTVIGIQIFYLIKETRQIVHKVNTTVDNVSGFTSKISSSVGSLAGFSAGMNAAMSLVSLLKKRSENNNKEE